jgi:formylglycine-generating enzyme required for sulfatase activity
MFLISFQRSVIVICALLISCCVSQPPAKVPGWINSLGMNFVKLPAGEQVILMASLETQERHLAPFRRDQGRAASDAEVPARHVSWLEATDFCRWLTQKERRAGVIGPHQAYRLPTDHEWSCAVGLGGVESAQESPEAKSNRILGQYPWGPQWPPPAEAGNLCGRESRQDFPENFIDDYRDGFSGGEVVPQASVANDLGLYDLSGNLWEWCEDRFRTGTDWRVLRGGSWKTARAETLLSSHRTHDPESYRSDSVGFRCVLAGAK